MSCSAGGVQDVRITQATRDGGADARITYRRGIVEARAIVSAKRWTTRTVGVEEVRMLRGLPGNKDTAIVVTTGKFSADAQEESKPSQNQRPVYLIDGESLVEICKRNQIGVKKVQLPDLLVLDPEVIRDFGGGEDADEGDSEVADTAAPDDVSSARRLRDEMLSDSERGLSGGGGCRAFGVRAQHSPRISFRRTLGRSCSGEKSGRTSKLGLGPYKLCRGGATSLHGE
ncbi:MAG: restriction endonuclease [Bryobacteraceae bacterium]